MIYKPHFLLVIAAITESMYAIVNNTFSTAAPVGNESGRPTFNDANGSTAQPPSRPEGGEGEASLGGLAGILGTLARLSVLTTLIVLAEKGLNQLKKRATSAIPA